MLQGLVLVNLPQDASKIVLFKQLMYLVLRFVDKYYKFFHNANLYQASIRGKLVELIES